LTTNKNNMNVQLINQKSTYLSHLKFFNEIVDSYLEKSKLIMSGSVDKFEFYGFIFVNPGNGDFNISHNYKTEISKINDAIIKLNKKLPKKLGYVEHRDLLIESFGKMGIKVPRSERRDFFKLESELFGFLNNINRNNGLKPLNTTDYNPYDF